MKTSLLSTAYLIFTLPLLGVTPVLHFGFDENDGPDILDDALQPDNAVMVILSEEEEITRETGVFGKAVRFSPTDFLINAVPVTIEGQVASSDFTITEYPINQFISNFEWESDFGIAFWFRRVADQPPNSGLQLLTLGQTMTVGISFATTTEGTKGTLRWDYTWDGYDQTTLTQADHFSVEEWNHFVLQRVGPVSRIYVNGQLVGETDMTLSLPQAEYDTDPDLSNKTLILGGKLNPLHIEPFDLDEFWIWEGALQPGQMTSLIEDNRLDSRELRVTNVELMESAFQIDFTGPPNTASTAWRVKGSSSLINFPDDLTALSTITEMPAGSGNYRAVVDVSGRGPKYFVRIELP